MTQIANVRQFNGTSDRIQLTPSQLVTAWSGFTWAGIIQVVDSAAWKPVLCAAEPKAFYFGIDNAEGDFYDVGGVLRQSTVAFATQAMGWVLIGASKASGTSAGTFHRYRYDTQAWTHEAEGATTGDVTVGATSEVYISYDGAVDNEFFNGKIAMLAVWTDQTLSDADFETLPNDIAAWDALTPSAAWLLDQASTAVAVEDRVGGCDESVLTGTSVAAEGSLAFDVGGAPDPLLSDDPAIGMLGRGAGW